MNLFESPQEKQQSQRLQKVVDSILYELQQQGYDGVYVEKLGLLVVAFEGMYYDTYQSQFLAFEDSSYQPTIVNTGLEYALESYPSRRAYPNNKRSHKISTKTVTPPKFEYMDIVSKIVQDAQGCDAQMMKAGLRASKEKLYWVEDS